MIPLTFFFYLYIALVVIVSLFGFFNLITAIKHSDVDRTVVLATLLFLGTFAIALIISFIFISQINWQDGFALFSNVTKTAPTTTF